MKFKLEKYNGSGTRHTCPACKSKSNFTLYVNSETNEIIDYSVGRCNRQGKCTYHLPPKQYFSDNNINIMQNKPFKSEPQQIASYIDLEVLKKSMMGYDANNFIIFLKTLFNEKIVSKLIDDYLIGTSKKWNGANVFWQVDMRGRIRTGKIMLYNELTGRRNKEMFPPISWAHKALQLKYFNLEQCFFGEHLLKGNQKIVAIVESEKTAIISSVFFPEFVWIACGGLENLSMKRCAVLKGRNVMLYPDLNGFDKWQGKAKTFGFRISSLLENDATDEERSAGLDLADYLIKSQLSIIDL